MSIKVLEALVGAKEVTRLEQDERHRLCDAIDAEILRDDQLLGRLLLAVKEAARELEVEAKI